MKWLSWYNYLKTPKLAICLATEKRYEHDNLNKSYIMLECCECCEFIYFLVGNEMGIILWMLYYIF